MYLYKHERHEMVKDLLKEMGHSTTAEMVKHMDVGYHRTQTVMNEMVENGVLSKCFRINNKSKKRETVYSVNNAIIKKVDMTMEDMSDFLSNPLFTNKVRRIDYACAFITMRLEPTSLNELCANSSTIPDMSMRCTVYDQTDYLVQYSKERVYKTKRYLWAPTKGGIELAVRSVRGVYYPSNYKVDCKELITYLKDKWAQYNKEIA